MHTFKTPLHAAKYIRWWGHGDNCLHVPAEDRSPEGESYGPGSKLRAAEEQCWAAPALLELNGPCGPGKIIGVEGSDHVAFVDGEINQYGERPIRFLRVEVGGLLSQKVAQYRLGEGRTSQWISGCYSGGCIALTESDAELLGIGKCRTSAIPEKEEAILFGSHVK